MPEADAPCVSRETRPAQPMLDRQSARVAPIEGCLACDLATGRINLPGGRIHETRHWLVEHCRGPLGVGTLIVKPRRHVLRVADLQQNEAGELGGVLRQAARAVDALIRLDQVYVTLWSHAGAKPVQIQWVVQPVTRELMAMYKGLGGPFLQAAMFERDELPPAGEVEVIADRVRDCSQGVKPLRQTDAAAMLTEPRRLRRVGRRGESAR